MTHTTLNPPVDFAITARPRPDLRAMLISWYADIVKRHRQRKAIRELRSLDARLLRDMGLHRGMIVDVVINGDPRRTRSRSTAPTTSTPAAPIVPIDPVDAWARRAMAGNGFGG